MEDEEEISYENKHLVDLTEPHEPSEEQYLESLKDKKDKDNEKPS